MARIVVAGAGAIGAAIAYHLALRGARRRRARRPGRDRLRRDGKGDGRRAPAVLDGGRGAARAGERPALQELGEPLFEQVGYLFLATTEDWGSRSSRSAAARRSACRSSASTPLASRACGPTTCSGRRSAARTASPILPASRASSSGARRRWGRGARADGRARRLPRDVLVVACGAHSPEAAAAPSCRSGRSCRQLVDVGPVDGVPADLPMTIEDETASTSGASATTCSGSR